MKASIALALFTAACVGTDAVPARLDVVLYAAPGDVQGDQWTLRPSDYLIDQTLHVTGIMTEGADRDLDATISSGDAIALDGSDLGVVGWYAP